MNDDWWDDAACIGLDTQAFFPEKGEIAPTARRVCGRCPVQGDCLAWALKHHEHGIWGGVGYKERQRQRRAEVAA